MEVNLVTEGLKFLVLGMTTVFLFLILMIYILKLQAFLIQKYFSEDDNKNKTSPNVVPTPETDSNAELIAVITAAITDFRKNR